MLFHIVLCHESRSNNALHFAMLLKRNNIYHVQPIYRYIYIHLICTYFPLLYLKSFYVVFPCLSHTYITHSFTFEVHVFSFPEHQGRHVQELQGLLPACHIGTAGRQGGERKQGPLEAMMTHLLGHGSWEITELVGVIPNGTSV